eukprot:gene15751-biopygen5444
MWVSRGGRLPAAGTPLGSAARPRGACTALRDFPPLQLRLGILAFLAAAAGDIGLPCSCGWGYWPSLQLQLGILAFLAATARDVGLPCNCNLGYWTSS